MNPVGAAAAVVGKVADVGPTSTSPAMPVRTLVASSVSGMVVLLYVEMTAHGRQVGWLGYRRARGGVRWMVMRTTAGVLLIVGLLAGCAGTAAGEAGEAVSMSTTPAAEC